MWGSKLDTAASEQDRDGLLEPQQIINIQQYIITVHKITGQPTITYKPMSYMSSLKKSTFKTTQP